MKQTEKQIYTVSSGVLTREDDGKKLLRIVNAPGRCEKRISTMEGIILGRTEIRGERSGHNRGRSYVLLDTLGKTCAVVRPGYAKGEDPEEIGWPIHRMPTVDHAEVMIDGEMCMLTMHSAHHYTLSKIGKVCRAQLTHRGLCGGWRIESESGFTPKTLSAFYVFCRYMEQENEFPMI